MMGISYSITSILEQEYEIKMISKMNNYPNVDMENDNLKDICVLLHNNVSINRIKEYFKWTQEEFLERINILIKEDLIIETDKGYKPNLMIISLEDFKYISNSIENVSCEVFTLIENNRCLIKNKTLELECFKPFTFESLSIFILSDVILDFIQIDNVEELLLKKDRTKHGNKYYYYSLQEKQKGYNKEAFGIYGNQIDTYGKNMFGVYGNERDRINFNNIEIDNINEYFLHIFNDYKDEKALKTYLLNELIKYFKSSSYALNYNILTGFNSLGIMKGTNINIPVITENEFYKLSGIADIIKEEYIEILQKYKPTLYYNYINSIYSSEISFEEYFIWWYHVLYSRVTDMMIEQCKIVVPDKINFSYLIID